MKYPNLIRIVFLLLVVLTSVAHAKPTKLDSVVAIVNDDVITDSELLRQVQIMTQRFVANRDLLPPEDVLKKQVLDRAVVDLIQVQFAEKTGIEVDSLMISQQIKQMANAEGLTPEQFQRAVEEQGINFKDFREYLRKEIIISMLQRREVARDISISESDIQSFLDSPIGQDQTGVEYRLGHILVMLPDRPSPADIAKTKKAAEDIVKKLNEGASFEQMAMSSSAGHLALRGGDLSWRKMSELPTLFVKYVPSMELGEVSQPIRSASGFHIIKLQNKRVGSEEVHVETRVRQILIQPSPQTSDDEAKQYLAKIREQIENGGDFAKLAEQKSEELSTAAKGGDLGWVSENSVLPIFYRKMAKLSQGEISRPFKTDLGWHLIQVTDRRSQLNSSEAARNHAQRVLQERKFNELLASWLKRIRDEAKVEIVLNT